MAMVLCAAAMGSSPAACGEAQTASSFCVALNKAVTPLVGGADAIFIRSYEPGTDEAPLPAGIATRGFVYDNALADIALIDCGNVSERCPYCLVLRRVSRVALSL